MAKAVNPETGEVLFLVDNQWVAPAQTAVNEQGQKAYLLNNQWVDDSLKSLMPETSALGYVGETLKAIPRGAIGMLETAGIGASAILPEETEKAARAGIKSLAESARSPFGVSPGYEGAVPVKLGEALGSTAPFFALGPLGVAGRLTGAGLGVAAGAGEARTRAEEAGATPEERAMATAFGAPIGALEMLPVSRFTKALGEPLTGSIIQRGRRVLEAAGAEGLQEFVSETAQNLVQQRVYDPTQGMFTGTGEAFGYGAGVGGLIQGLTDMVLGKKVKGPKGKKAVEPGQETEQEVAPEAYTDEEAARQDILNKLLAGEPAQPDLQQPLVADELTQEPAAEAPVAPEISPEIDQELAQVEPPVADTTEPFQIEAEPVSPDEIETPQTPVAQPQEAEPITEQPKFSQNVFRGTGRADKESVYTTGTTPVLGDAKYYAFDSDTASKFGPNVEQANISLNNPLVVESDEQWRALTKEAGWKYPNPSMLPEAEKAKATNELNKLIKSRGHDGVVVNFDPSYTGDILPDGRGIKTLRNVFGDPQVIAFDGKPVKPKAQKTVKPAPVLYGVDPESGDGMTLRPVTEGGQFFPTKQDAQKAKKMNPGMGLRRTKDGYTLAPPTEGQIAARKASAERLKKADPEAPLERFIAAAGGLQKKYQPDLRVDGNLQVGNRWLLAGEGKGLDEDYARDIAIEAGYQINDGESIIDAINRSLSEKPIYSINAWDKIAEKYGEEFAEYEDYLAGSQQSAAPLKDAGFSDEQVAKVSKDPADAQAEAAAIQAYAEKLGVDTYAIEEDVARDETLSKEQYEAEIARRIGQAIEQAERTGSPDIGEGAIDQIEEQGPFDVTKEIQTVEDLKQLNEDIRDAKIREYQSLKQQMAAITRRKVEYKEQPVDDERFRSLYKAANNLKAEIEATRPIHSSPEDVMARAAKELANGNISRDVYDVFDAMFKKNPDFLDGLRLSVKQGQDGVAGQFLPMARIVRLFKGYGAFNPGTARHELTHSMEQMMTPEARVAVVEAWRKALTNAMKTDKTKAGEKYFKAITNFLENPTQKAQQEAINAMPSYEYYQYLNPSEYWAINAEPLMNAYLGTGWQRFKMSMRGVLEAIKKVLGLDNKHPVYSAFKDAINGERRTTEMLIDYIGSVAPIYNIKKNYQGNPAPLPTWQSPPDAHVWKRKQDILGVQVSG